MYESSLLNENEESAIELVDLTSSEVGVGQSATRLGMTADLDKVALLLEAGQAGKITLKNSVEQHCSSEPISTHLRCSGATKDRGNDSRNLSDENSIKRATYSLEQVSRSLDEIMASGKAIIEGLALVNGKKPGGKHSREGSSSELSSSKPDMKSPGDLKRRGAYDVDKVADIIHPGDHEGVSVEDSLNEDFHLDQGLGEHSQDNVSRSVINRNTYDLDDLSVKLDEIQKSGSSLDELLKELECTGNIVSDGISSERRHRRGTYNLDDVSGKLEDSLRSGQCLEESLDHMSSESNHSNQSDLDKRRTYDLSEPSSEQDQGLDGSVILEDSSNQNMVTDIGLDQDGSGKRRTYQLSDVSNELDTRINSGKSLEDTLELISSAAVKECQSQSIKRRTYDLSDSVLNVESLQQVSGGESVCNNNVMDCKVNRQPGSNQTVMKNSMNSQSKKDKTAKQGTYTLDNVESATDVSLSNGVSVQDSYIALSEDQTHQNGILITGDGRAEENILSELGLSGENGEQEVLELTPNQWMEQMKGLKQSPNGSKESHDASRIMDSQGEPVSKENGVNKGIRRSQSVTKPASSRSPGVNSSGISRSNSERSSSSSSGKTSRSRSLSGSVSSSRLGSRSASEQQSRSVSKSGSCSELKSCSSPDFTSSTKFTPEKNSSFESWKEISPGVRNYLQNKLGLSEELCKEVHRRLSCGSDSSIEPSKLEHQKTYSLDDVAHSLDIATSQGLPMTKVINQLDSEQVDEKDAGGDERSKKMETKPDIEDVQSKESTSDVKASKTSLQPNTPVENGSVRTVVLRSNFVQSKSLLNRRTYTLNKGGDLIDGKQSAKASSTPLDDLCQFKLSTRKAVYKPSAKLHSFSHLVGERSGQSRLRNARTGTSDSKRRTYTLESVAETLEKAQDAGVPMIDALKRLSGSCKAEKSETSNSNRRTYSLEDISNTLETAASSGIPIVETLQKIAEPDETEDGKTDKKEKQFRSSKKKAPPKPKRTFQKTEIKFVSDSFVIEYFTSPKKPQSTSFEGDGSGDVTDQSTVDGADGRALVHSASKPKEIQVPDDKAVLSPTGKVSSSAREGSQPTAKVVNDLDSLLARLAAAVDPTKESESSGVERATDGSTATKSSVDEVEEMGSQESTEPIVDVTRDGLCNAHELSQVSDIPGVKVVKDKVVCLPKTGRDSSPNDRDLPVPYNNKHFSMCDSTSVDEGYCTLSRKIENGNRVDEDVSPSFEESLGGVRDRETGKVSVSNKTNSIQIQESDATTVEDRELLNVSEDSGQSQVKHDGVSRELNLLRLKLAEKQRDIEAQKQRTKEQLEEERKRFGQNVFWYAVGKGREKKDTNDNEAESSKKDLKKYGSPLPNISGETWNSSELGSTQEDQHATFTKQSLPDEELPPSMNKLQDRTYNLKSIDESLRGSSGDLINRPDPFVASENQTLSGSRETVGLPVNWSVDDRNASEEVVHEFRLSRQTPGSQLDPMLNKVQTTPKPDTLGNANGPVKDSEKPRAPVMNYKSRISVPLTYSSKPVSENVVDIGHSRYVTNSQDAPATLTDEDSNQAPSSPTRKCWDVNLASRGEPQLAVSQSNYHIFEQNDPDNGIKGDTNLPGISGNWQGISETQQELPGDQQQVPKNVDFRHGHQLTYTRNTDSDLRNDHPQKAETDGHLDSFIFLTNQINTEKTDSVNKSSSVERSEANGNSPSSENDHETAKKGLALFIGDQKSPGKDGFTPEQLKKRERFLKSRQQKMEEDKIKKEAILEKKRRKDEKMKELQLRREREEHERQASLQEKKEQAEHARQERQKYELKRKENLPRPHVVDGIPSGYAGYAGHPRTEVIPPLFTPVPGEVSPFRLNAPAPTPSPSSFSSFTGVQSYVKPSGKTNRKLIINAISHVCLPGAVNKETKEKCLQAMTESSAQHFLILFREGLKFRGLYSLDPENHQVLKVHGVGPRSVTEKMVHRLYKYNSGGKEFSELPAKSFSLSVDGFTLQKSCWQSNKPSVPSKTLSNYKQARPTR